MRRINRDKKAVGESARIGRFLQRAMSIIDEKNRCMIAIAVSRRSIDQNILKSVLVEIHDSQPVIMGEIKV